MFYINYDRLVTSYYCTLSLVLVRFNANVILPIPWHRHVSDTMICMLTVLAAALQ